MSITIKKIALSNYGRVLRGWAELDEPVQSASFAADGTGSQHALADPGRRKLLGRL